MKRKPKYLHETPEDKQLRKMLVSMIGSIFLCLFCLVGTTWAWFETTLVSTDNVLSVGEMKVQVINTKGGTSTKSELVPSEPDYYILRDVGTYTIELTNTGTIPGYCVITISDATGASESFTSGTLNPIGYNATDSATITIEITAEDNYNGILPVTLHIQPQWGNDPSSAVQDIDEDLFVPETEATTPAPTEETSPTASTEATEGSSQPSEPEVTEPAAPSEPENTEPTTPATSEPTDPTATEATDPTDSTDNGGSTDPSEEPDTEE